MVSGDLWCSNPNLAFHLPPPRPRDDRVEGRDRRQMRASSQTVADALDRRVASQPGQSDNRTSRTTPSLISGTGRTWQQRLAKSALSYRQCIHIARSLRRKPKVDLVKLKRPKIGSKCIRSVAITLSGDIPEIAPIIVITAGTLSIQTLVDFLLRQIPTPSGRP